VIERVCACMPLRIALSHASLLQCMNLMQVVAWYRTIRELAWRQRRALTVSCLDRSARIYHPTWPPQRCLINYKSMMYIEVPGPEFATGKALHVECNGFQS